MSSEIIQNPFADPDQGPDPASVALAKREQTSVQAAAVLARQFPRNEADAYTKVIKACRRPTFAEKARYIFPRSGQDIEGPSVKFAREAARAWGNIDYGFTCISRTDQYTTLEGWCIDWETNTRSVNSVTFGNLVFRRGKGWIQPDERDYRELVNRQGAILERNAILKVLPPDVVEEAMAEIRRTNIKAAKGEIEQDRSTTTRKLAVAFRDIGVTVEMIEQRLGHPLDLITAEEVADLRGIYTSILEGQARREEFFQTGAAATPAATEPPSKIDNLTDELKNGRKKKPQPATDEPPQGTD